MADVITQHDIGGYGTLRTLSAISSAVAGGAGNGAQVSGIVFDRLVFGLAGLPGSLVAGIVFASSLSAGDTLGIAYEIQTSPDGSTWTPLASANSAVVATGPTGGGAVNGQLNVPLDLTGSARYLQVKYTPTLSAASTDTAETVAVGFFAGFPVLPAPL